MFLLLCIIWQVEYILLFSVLMHCNLINLSEQFDKCIIIFSQLRFTITIFSCPYNPKHITHVLL